MHKLDGGANDTFWSGDYPCVDFRHLASLGGLISVHKHTTNMSKPTRIHARFQSHTSSKLGNEKGSGPCEIPYLKEERDANLISARKGKVRSGDAKEK